MITTPSGSIILCEPSGLYRNLSIKSKSINLKNLSPPYCLRLGQKSDMASDFNIISGFSGEVSQLSVFNFVLDDDEILNASKSCGGTIGNVFSWTDFTELRGEITLRGHSMCFGKSFFISHTA